MKCLHPVALYAHRPSPEGKERLSGRCPDTSISCQPKYLVPCGKCTLCRARKRQDWIRRITLESWLHDDNTFITLTYDDSHLPSDGLVNKSDVQKFIKRLRHSKRDYGVSIPDFKYFIVSEYGSKYGRPHYHGILFGVDMRNNPVWLPVFACLDKDGHSLYTSKVLERIWTKGFVTVDRLTPGNVAYVTKYITKSDNSGFRLFSRGFGKRLFFDDDGFLSSFGERAYNNGFLVFPLRDGRSVKGPIPKNIDRYYKLSNPFLYEIVSDHRRRFALSLPFDSAQSLADARDSINIKIQQELKMRKYDNES